MKQYHFGLVGKDRKALVSAVSDILGIPSKYCAAPNYEYQIGDYEVTRVGTLVGPENISLVAWLADRGFEVAKGEAQPEADSSSPEAVAEPETGPETATEPEASPNATMKLDASPEANTEPDTSLEANTEPEGGTPRTESLSTQESTAENTPEPETPAEPDNMTLTIEYPLEGMTEDMIINLRKLIAAKEPLLQMALGADEIPILLTPETLKFPWFRGEINGDTAKAYAQLISCLCENAKRKKRVNAQVISTDNPRFCMRTWLVNIGMVGAEYDFTRKLLCGKLPGDSGHRYSGHDTTTARKSSAGVRRPAKEATISEEARAQILDIQDKGTVKMLNIHDVGELAKENGYQELAELVQTDPISYVSFILASEM